MSKPYSLLRRQLLRSCLLLGALALPLAAHADWDKIKASGRIKVAVYKDNAPFSDGKPNQLSGIDVALAQALADAMGLKVDWLPFDAGEDMRDDLRNMVWKGHYLGYGPADLMMHVPVDPRFMQQNEQAFIFGPYYRETVVLAHDLKRLPEVKDAEDLKGQPLVTETGSAAASALLGALDGALRPNVHMEPNGQAATRYLLSGKATAVMTTRSQIESALPADVRANYALTTLPLRGVPPKGWSLGMAIKADQKPLAEALDAALTKLKNEGKLKALFEQYGVSWTAP